MICKANPGVNDMKKAVCVMVALLLAVTLSVPSFAAEEKLTFLALGDSIAKGSGLINQSQGCYTRIVCDTNGYEYINEGVDGNQSWQLLEQLQSDERVRGEVAHADIIDISIGGNNFLKANILKLFIGGILMGNTSLITEIVDDYAEDLDEIITVIRELNPDAQIIMQTLYNPAPKWLSDSLEAALDIFNGSIYAYLEENPDAFAVADVRSAFEGHPEYSELIHPNAQGNKVIAQVILNLLSELGYEGSTEPVITYFAWDSWEYYVAVIIGFMI